jgi:hypothetical protein
VASLGGHEAQHNDFLALRQITKRLKAAGAFGFPFEEADSHNPLISLRLR